MLRGQWPVRDFVEPGFILQTFVSARLGGMAGPAAVMGAWAAARAWRSRNVLAIAVLLLAVPVTVWSVSVTADWPNELRRDRFSWDRLRNHYQAAATPAGETLPYGPWFGMVMYLRECTSPSHRVYASWFVPELYFYAQRGFAAGVSVTFGHHWSEPRYQQYMVRTLAAQAVPVVLIHARSYDDFQSAYPEVARYLQAEYRLGGETDFGDSEAGPGAYLVLTHRNRVASGIHAASSMPCFK
jgi:hypothetical protein